jgi:hypothetical protein
VPALVLSCEHLIAPCRPWYLCITSCNYPIHLPHRSIIDHRVHIANGFRVISYHHLNPFNEFFSGDFAVREIHVDVSYPRSSASPSAASVSRISSLTYYSFEKKWLLYVPLLLYRSSSNLTTQHIYVFLVVLTVKSVWLYGVTAYKTKALYIITW